MLQETRWQGNKVRVGRYINASCSIVEQMREREMKKSPEYAVDDTEGTEKAPLKCEI